MNKNIFFVIIAICCLALGGIFVKLSAFPPITTGMYRVLFSLPLFFVLIYTMKLEIDNRSKIISILAGCFLALDLILWNISFNYTTVANANLLANLVPFTVVPLSYFLYKEKVSRTFLMSLVIILVGLVLLMVGKISPSLTNFKGDLLAIATSVFYGLFMITVYKLRDKVATIAIMGYASIGCLGVLLPVSLIVEGVYIPKSYDEFYPLLGLAFLSQILGQGGLSYCLGKIKASIASLLVLLQPVISAVYAWLIFSEKLSSTEMVGIGVVLLGLYVGNKKEG